MARPKKKARRAYGEGSITRRKNGLYVGRLRLGYKPDGSPRIVQCTSMDWDQVVEKMDAIKSQFREYGVIVDKRTTLATWAEKWLAEIKSLKAGPNTFSTDASLIRKWVIPTIGNRILSELKPSDIRAVQTAMKNNVDKAGNSDPRSSSTALRAYRTLSSCLEAARRDGLVAWNVADKVDAPTKAVSARGSFTVEQMIDIITAAGRDPELGARYVAQLFMGLRQGETLGLTWDCVDLVAGVVLVAWQLQTVGYKHNCGQRGADGRYPCGYKQAMRCPSKTYQVPDGYEYRELAPKLLLTRPKSRAGWRPVPLIPPMLHALAAHRERTMDAPNPHGLVWSNDGHPIDEQTDQEGWKQLMRSVGLPDTCTTHWARHSVASLLKAAGVDTVVIGEIVGHGSTGVTEGYIHVSSQLAKDAMGRLDKMLTA